MVGKTNLTFISKGEASSVQLIQKSYVTGATGSIYKMEVLNDKLFVFVINGYVLSGSDMDNLDIIQKDNAPLKASHIVYADGRYYIMDADGTDSNKTSSDFDDNRLYATYDFEAYEEITIPEDLDEWKNVGIFLNSSGKIVLSYITKGSDKIRKIKICMCESLKDISTWYRSGEKTLSILYTNTVRSFMVDDKIYVEKNRLVFQEILRNA